MEGVEEPIRYVICFRACLYNIYNMYPYFEQVFFPLLLLLLLVVVVYILY